MFHVDPSAPTYSFVWRGMDAPRMEFAKTWLRSDGLSAMGEQIGVDGGPYHVHYWLQTGPDLTFRSLLANAMRGDGGSGLFVMRDENDVWRSKSFSKEKPERNFFDFDVESLAGALDVDLGYSPLFNSTPVLRDRLHEDGAEPRDYVMAWVSVPDLTLTASHQRYEPIGRRGDLSIVRYTSLDSGFTAEIGFDDDGFVVTYEGFLERIAAERPEAS